MSNLTNNTEKLQSLLTKINELPSAKGIDTSDATATASDIAKDKTAYVNGEKVTGNVTIVGGNTLYTYSTNTSVGEETSEIKITTQTLSSDMLFRAGTQIQVRSSKSNFGDATVSDVAAGKTFTSSAGLKMTGTMTVDNGWEKVQFLLEGSGEASLSTNIYGGGAFYIDFASPISAFTGLSFIYGYENRSGYESDVVSVTPGYSEGTYLGLYHNFDYGDEDEDGFVPGTYGDAVYDWGITASLTSSTKIQVNMNAIGDYIEDTSSRHYGYGVVFVKYL